MKEPLEQQTDFVWTTFEFVDDDALTAAHRARYRTPITPAAASAATSGVESPSRSLQHLRRVLAEQRRRPVVGERRRAEAERRAHLRHGARERVRQVEAQPARA